MITFHGASDKIKIFVMVYYETYRQQQFLPFQHTAAHQYPCKNKLGMHFSLLSRTRTLLHPGTSQECPGRKECLFFLTSLSY